MASSSSGDRLTEAHRRTQLRLGAQVVVQMRAAWRLIDVEDVDGTTDRWLRVALPLIRSQRTASSTLASNYYRTFRGVELGTAAQFTPRLAATPALDKLGTALTVTGPVAVKKSMTLGRTLNEAMRVGEARTAGAAMRLALGGGRETLMQSVAADPRALGHARATSGNACAFCQMLASRGPAYSESGADFQAHDNCSCSAEPVFHRDAAWPAGAREARERWEEVTQGLGGNDALNAFRQSLNA